MTDRRVRIDDRFEYVIKDDKPSLACDGKTYIGSDYLVGKEPWAAAAAEIERLRAALLEAIPTTTQGLPLG